VRIETVLSEAQGGQAFANLARAFHLPADKVEAAVATMVGELIGRIAKDMHSQPSLAALVELLGQNGYEQALDTPTLLAAPHTQVIGNDALKVIAGHDESETMVKHAAAAADVSEMITEYLLPVVVAMMIGALARESRPGLNAIIGHTEAAGSTDQEQAGASAPQLPLVAGGVGFSGSTGGTVGIVHPAATPSHYLELAEQIKRTEDPAQASAGAADAVRSVLEPILGMSGDQSDWMDRIRTWRETAIKAVRGTSRPRS
jgi:hypothetical protein